MTDRPNPQAYIRGFYAVPATPQQKARTSPPPTAACAMVEAMLLSTDPVEGVAALACALCSATTASRLVDAACAGHQKDPLAGPLGPDQALYSKTDRLHDTAKCREGRASVSQMCADSRVLQDFVATAPRLMHTYMTAITHRTRAVHGTFQNQCVSVQQESLQQCPCPDSV